MDKFSPSAKTKPKIIAVVGPTSSGKTALGIYLAKKFNGEIISADSRQVYKGLDIATGKVTKREMAGVPHHLLDVASPKRKFSAGDFVKRAERAIASIHKRGALPIIVGGTGYYADALLGRFIIPEVKRNAALRARLEQMTAAQLYTLLKKKDPRRAMTIEPAHKRRLVRALEIADALGKNPEPRTDDRYDVLWLGVSVPVKMLESRIEQRVTSRLKRGMIAEAKRLHKAGISYKRMDELGLEYRALAKHLQGRATRKELAEEIFQMNRKYAKRQLRWLKRNPNIKWATSRREALRFAKLFFSRQ